ncbi:hypothetical protein BJ973_004040 [Actinoplanes tereljensis]|uniref:Uncharacterized protein n=1 Tax=Paractinoplanes tereljensis TaxID=571912 RepID=A0A919NSB6_9ACTN|nr:hypothetical protein [Actinoplanes tereljensis]GIF23428.1 hypothetical protein Ate02nite_61580 [Actinoplanes tereljensis]
MARSSRQDFAFFEAPDDFAGFLRVNDLVIVCGARGITIEAAVQEPMEDDLLGAEAVEERERPTVSADPKEEPVDPEEDEAPAREPVQLALPFPVSGRRRGRQPSSRAERPSLAIAGMQRTPRGVTPKRE